MGNWKIELKWAIVFVVVQLLWILLERLTGLHGIYIDRHAIYTNFIAIPATAVYVFALLDKRKNFYHGKMTYLQGLTSGLIITLIVTIVTPLTQVIVSELITPQYFGNAIVYSTTEGKLTQEQAVEYFSLKNYIILGLIGAPIMGFITSAIVALFTRGKSFSVPESGL